MIWPFSLLSTGGAVESPSEARSLENPEIPISDPRCLEIIFGRVSGSVSRSTILALPAVWCSVQFIASTIAALPLHSYRKEGSARERTGGRIEQLISRNINREWTSFRWRKYCMQEALLEGRALTLINRGDNGQGLPVSFRALKPTAIEVDQDNDGNTIYRNIEENVTYQASEIIDVPWMLADDGITHINPVAKLAESLGLTESLGKYAKQLFDNGGIPPMILQGPINSPAAAVRASNDITRSLMDRKNRNVLVMPPGHELKQVGFNPEDGQMIEARRFQIEEVARVYNLPPIFLQDLTHGTYANTEQQDLHVVKHTVMQWLRNWEQELNLKLFQSNTNRFVEFNVDGLLRGDFQSRMDGYSKAITNGVYKPSEAREKENLPPDPTGDVLLAPANTLPIDKLGEKNDSNRNAGNPDDND